MNSLPALISAVTTGKAELLQLALIELQQSLRLTAAIFLPTLREVDTVVRRLGTTMARELASIPRADSMSWVRTQLRRLIAQRLDELEKNFAIASDPLFGRLIASGRERLEAVPIDVDLMTPLNQRLRFMSKGAVDLLTFRFSKKLLFTQIATQRLMSLDDVSDAVQTACRQLDWTGDASGAALDASDYRVIDQVVCGDEGVIEETDPLRLRLHDNIGLALRAVRAARLHVIAAAWYASAFTVEMPVLAPPPSLTPASAPVPAAPSKRPSNGTMSVAKTRMISTPIKRQPVSSFDKVRSRELHDNPERQSKSGLIATIISGVLVLTGVGLLLLRSGTNDMPMPVVKQEPTMAPTIIATPLASTNSSVSTPISQGLVPSVSPTVSSLNVSKEQPLFSPGSTTAPLAAWSTRRLVPGYNGPLLRIRRSSDNVESDIGATTSGSLDTSALMIFISRMDAQVVCWYDQSGNNHHLRQTDLRKQPSIVKAGNPMVENSRPVISWHSKLQQYLTTPAGIPIGCLYAVVLVEPHKGATQAIMGSLAKRKSDHDAYYPIVDRGDNGQCEWWLGQQTGQRSIKAPIPQNRLLLWHSSRDGNIRPHLTLRLDGKQVGAVQMDDNPLLADGPTTVGAGYWQGKLADYFAGVTGEIIVLLPGSNSKEMDAITDNLKAWWRTP